MPNDNDQEGPKRRALINGLRASLAALAALACLCLAASAEARGTGAAPQRQAYAVAWQVQPHDFARRHVHRYARTASSSPAYVAPDWRHGAPAIAARAAWGAASDVVAVARRYLGSGNFTGYREAWCADAVNSWLRSAGRRPMSGRSAYSALAYGPRTANPREGDLIVMPHHVGVFEGWDGGRVRMISGNWSHRVKEATISQAQVIAFVSTEGGSESAEWRPAPHHYAGPPHRRCRVCYVHHRRFRWA